MDFTLSYLLAKQIATMFLMLLCGFLVVRCGLLKVEHSRVLSIIAVYVVSPCMVIDALQIEYTAERAAGLALTLFAAVVVYAVFIVLDKLLNKLIPMKPVEQASVIYTNGGNLILPLVTAIMGTEMAFYTCSYIIIHSIMSWTHGVILICGEKKINWIAVLKNVNIIAILAGAALFFLRIPLPDVMANMITTTGAMIGPVCMIAIGMLIGGADLKKIVKNPRVWLICLLRLIVFPLVIVLVFVFSGMQKLTPDAPLLLLISLLSAAAPCAQMVTQLSQIYNQEPEYASQMNVLSTLLCILTMPIIVAIYQSLI